MSVPELMKQHDLIRKVFLPFTGVFALFALAGAIYTTKAVGVDLGLIAFSLAQVFVFSTIYRIALLHEIARTIDNKSIQK